MPLFIADLPGHCCTTFVVGQKTMAVSVEEFPRYLNNPRLMVGLFAQFSGVLIEVNTK